MSCGCYVVDLAKKNFTTHGASIGKKLAPEFVCYRSAKNRCNNESEPAYKYYGARGIQFLYDSYPEFLEDVGPRPSLDHSLGRIDNDGNYEPGNCQWETDVEQANNKRNNRFIEAFGRTQTIAQWSRETGTRSAE